MNLDELRSVRDEERESGSLQALRPSFYAEAREFIEAVREERDRLAAESDDPFSDQEVSRLSDRLESAEEVLESVFENRIAKLLRHASTAAAGNRDEPPPLTTEERELYGALVEAIASTKAEVLEGADRGSDQADTQRAAEDAAPSGEDPPEPEPSESEDAPEGDVGDDVERQTVRVVADVGTILGIDEREYDLAHGDVVSLPAENAKALIEREAAVAVED